MFFEKQTHVLPYALDIVWGGVEEGISDVACRGVEGDTDGLDVIASDDLGESGVDMLGAVRWDVEPGVSRTCRIKLIREKPSDW